MNIQIFGKSKCFDTKKAERYFKERRIPFQSIDLKTYGMSGREFDSVLRAVGGIDNLIDWDGKSPDITLMKYMDDQRAKEDKAFDNPALMKTPVVRNGKQATVGYCPEIWRRGNNIIDHESGSLKMESRFFYHFSDFSLAVSTKKWYARRTK
mgnify:CR=1 FL=1